MGISDKSYSEKRDFIRMKIGAPLNAKLTVPSGVIEGRCLDLSGGGLQIETAEPLPVGTEATVEVASDHGHNPSLKARVRVVRSVTNEAGNHLIGLEIIQIIV